MDQIVKLSRSAFLRFGIAHNSVQPRFLVDSALAFIICNSVMHLQILSLILPYDTPLTTAGLLSFKFLPSVMSPRTWIQQSAIQIYIIIGFLVITPALLLGIIIDALIKVMRSKEPSALYKFVIKVQIPMLYRSFFLFPSIEIGLLFLTKNLTFDGLICSPATYNRCAIALIVLGAVLVFLSLSSTLFYQCMTITCGYYSNYTGSQSLVKVVILHLVIPVVLGAISIEISDDVAGIGCALAWAGFLLFEVLTQLYIAEFAIIRFNRVTMIIKLISVYIIAQSALVYWQAETVAVIFPFGISVTIKLFLNLQQRILWDSWHNIDYFNTNRNHRVKEQQGLSSYRQDTSLRVLYNSFLIQKQLDYQLLEMLLPLIAKAEKEKLCNLQKLTEFPTPEPQRETLAIQDLDGEFLLTPKQTRQAEFLDTMKPSTIFENTTHSDPHKFILVHQAQNSLLSIIRAAYTEILQTRKGHVPPQLICSYLEFLVEVCQDYIQSMIVFSSLKKYCGEELGFREEIRLTILQNKIKKRLREQNGVYNQHLEEVCNHLEEYDACYSLTDQFVQDKATFHSKFLDAMINLRTVKADALNLLNRSTSLINRIEKIIKNQQKHIAPQLLHDFLVRIVQEDVNRSREIKDWVMRNRNDSKSDGILNGLDCEELLNCKLSNKLVFFVVSLDPQNEGALVAWSPNMCDVMGTSKEHFHNINLRELLPEFQIQYYFDLIKSVRNTSQLTELSSNEGMRNFFLRTKMGGLLNYKAQLEVQIFKAKPCLGFYLRSDMDNGSEMKYLLFDENDLAIGISEDLRIALSKKEIPLEILVRMNAQKIKMAEIFPLLQMAEKSTEVTTQGRTILQLGPSQLRNNSTAIAAAANDPTNAMDFVTTKNFLVEYNMERLTSDEINKQIIQVHIRRIMNAIADKLLVKMLLSNMYSDLSVVDDNGNQLAEQKSMHSGSDWIAEEQNEQSGDNFDVQDLDEGPNGPQQQLRPTFKSSEFGEQLLRPTLKSSEMGALGFRTLLSSIKKDSIQKMGTIQNKEAAAKRAAMATRLSTLLFQNTDIKSSKLTREHAVEEPVVIAKGKDDDVSSGKALHSKSAHKSVKKRMAHSVLDSEDTSASSKRTQSKLLLVVYRLKQLTNQGKTPQFLKQTNLFGHISFMLLALIIMIFFFILNNQYYYYAQFAITAYFPSYFASIMKSIYAVTELAISVNEGFVQDPGRRATLMRILPTTYAQRVQRFMEKYNQYFVQYDIRQVLPHISDNKNYSILMQRSEFDTYPNLYDFQAHTTILLGQTYKLNKTTFATLKNGQADVQFLRNYSSSYLDVYERMRIDLFTNFGNRRSEINTTLKIMIPVIVAACLLILIIFGFIVAKIHQQEVRIMSKLCTIPDEYTVTYLSKLQTVYKSYYSKPLMIRNVQANYSSKKGEKKEMRKLNTKKFTNNSQNSCWYLVGLTIASIILCAYVSVTAVTMLNKTAETIPFIENLDVNSGIVICMGLMNGDNLRQMNVVEVMEELNGNYDECLAKYGHFVNIYNNVQSRVLNNSVASDLLKIRYQNLTNSNFCIDVFGTPNHVYCVTAFNTASFLGFASLFAAEQDRILNQRTTFSADPTLETSLELIDSNDTMDISGLGPVVDATLVRNIELEGNFLYDYCMGLKQSVLYAILISGVLVVAALNLFIWRPMYLLMKKQFMQVRQVFSQLPVELIMHNNYIKNMLKHSGEGSM